MHPRQLHKVGCFWVTCHQWVQSFLSKKLYWVAVVHPSKCLYRCVLSQLFAVSSVHVCNSTQKYCTCWYQWVALPLRLLLSYPGMVAWIMPVGLMKIEKEKKITLRNFVQRSCKNIEQKCFIYHQMYHGDWESHRECLINTCINGWRHGIEYTQVQKLNNLLQKCTYVQPSINYFHKTAAGAVLFTGLPPLNLKSVSQYSIPHGR